jgi:DNA polymerase-4/DNA polymerase V
MDEVSEKYGKHSLHLGASHFIEVFGRGKRGEPTAREKTRFPGETKRRHLSIPILHVKV